MGLSYDGSITVGAILPTLQAQIGADFTATTAQLAAAVAALAQINASPPTLATSITTVTNLLAQLNAAVALGLPNVDLTISFNALISSLTATLGVLTALRANFSAAGVFAYTYSGPGNGLGPALTSELATQYRDATPSTTPGNAIVLVTHDPAVYAAMTAVFSGA